MLVVYRGHINNHILHLEHGAGEIKLSQFTAKRVGELRDRIRNAGVTVPTTRKVLATLHAVLAYAIGQDWIATNAAHGTKVIGPRNEGSKKIVPPSKVNMLSIINAADATVGLYIKIAASSGLRAGEQWALRWSDFDFDKAEINVSRRVDAYGEEGPPKSAAGMRSIPISEFIIIAIREWKLRSEFSQPNDLVFPNRKGRHLCHDNMVKRQYKPTLSRAGVSGINWHSLRHFAISTWIEARLEPKAVQTFAGHSSLQVTMDRYGHLFPSDDHRLAMDKIAEGLFQ
jgi:integrase